MKKLGFFVNVLAVCTLGLLAASAANAQNTRSWVAGDGDDANVCSVAAPCRTFASAITKTLAGGEINALRPGNFGPVTITKAITIDGGGVGIAGILGAGAGGAITVTAGTTDVVTIRNLTINGQSNGSSGSPGQFGIVFTAGASLIVENTIIEHTVDHAINFVPAAGLGAAGAHRLYVSDSTFSDSTGGAGVHVQAAGGGNAAVAQISNATFSNLVYGVLAEENSNASVTDSNVSGRVGNTGAVPPQTTFGFQVQLGGLINLERCSVTHTSTGIRAIFGTVRLSNCNIYGNGAGVDRGTPGIAFILSYGNNRISGNTIDSVGAGLILIPQS